LLADPHKIRIYRQINLFVFYKKTKENVEDKGNIYRKIKALQTELNLFGGLFTTGFL